MSRGARTCPSCGSSNTSVYETRDEGQKTVRRHLCKACGEKFRTVQEQARREWVRAHM